MSSNPNVVVIMTDQQRADHRRSEGFPLDTMPALDALAGQGADLTLAYTSTPVCAPARVSLLTGRYPAANRVRTNHNLEDAYFDRDLVQVFENAGYATALCGKNHTHLGPKDFDYWFPLHHGGGEGPDRSVQERGFDEYLTGLKHMTDPNPAPFPVECQAPYRAVSHAESWIGGLDGDKPFFLWLSFPEPHNPYQVPEPYFDLFPPEALPATLSDRHSLSTRSFKYRWLRGMWEGVIPDFEGSIPRTRSNYCGMLRLIDDQLSRFVRFLEERGLRDDTIIVFLSDHGDFVGEYGLIRKGPELPEVLCRIPLVIVGPGIPARGKVGGVHVSITDLMPTLCEAVGARIPAGVQGRSFWPVLTGEDRSAGAFSSVFMEHGFGGRYYDAEDTLDPAEEGALNDGCSFDELNSWTQAGTSRAVRMGRWKLVYDMEGSGELYDLEKDPVELDNLFHNPRHREIRGELVEELLRWTIRAQDPLPHPRRRYRFKG